MEIMIEHPQHGRMIVHHASEVERHAKWGWIEVKADTGYNDSTEKPAPAALADSPPAPPQKRKGRPPKGQ